MDELELLKKDWQQENTEFKIYSSEELYPMIHQKSSSIVKTLFYISIAELVFWFIINTIPYFCSDGYRSQLEAFYTNSFIITSTTIVSYAVIILFSYLLYKSHKTISVIDDSKTLMRNILKTRKIIKYYVVYNLILAFASFSFGLFSAFRQNEALAAKFANFDNKQLFVFAGIMLTATAAFVVVIWLFYKLIYGFLLQRLNRNYEELKKLEV